MWVLWTWKKTAEGGTAPQEKDRRIHSTSEKKVIDISRAGKPTEGGKGENDATGKIVLREKEGAGPAAKGKAQVVFMTQVKRGRQ